MDKRQEKFCICCPVCGRIHGRCETTVLELRCQKCSTYYVAQVNDGVVTVFKSRRKKERIAI